MSKRWLRDSDLNRGPTAYEAGELPGCSTPHRSQLHGSLFRYLTSVGGGLQQLRWLGCGHGLHYRPLSHDLDNAQVLDFVR